MTSSALKTIGIAAAVFVAVGTLAQELAAQPAQPGGASVIVVKAANACFSDRVRVTGFLVPRNEVVVTLDLEGFKITEVLANEGDKVTSGQTLARLTRPAIDMRGMAPPGAPPGAAAAPAGPTTATLRAPAGGIVTRKTATIGMVASPMVTEPLFRIMVDGEVELEVEVPAIHLPKLKSGATARVAIEDGPELNGRIRLVAAQVDPRTQLGRVRLSIDSEPSLRIGSFARATIDASRSCGVSIPRSAVINRTEGMSVQVVRDRIVETRRVKVGLLSDTSIEIREGLREGDIVVANAGTSLHDGDQVKTMLADESEQGRAR